ncbi:MAG: helix-turn-helix transcriptional regulator [Clostridia bacterium]|nr:helix-turn-helix transcriptional regulator [Clostridia bacterium]
MDKIKVNSFVPSVFPLLPLKILQLDASRFQAVEAANWWTLYYIDAGCAEIGRMQQVHRLTQFQGILLLPEQEHNLLTFRDSSATVIQLDLHITNRVAEALSNRPLLFDAKCRKLLREIVSESERYCHQTDKQKETEPLRNRELTGQYVHLLCEQLLLQLERCQYLWTDNKSFTVTASPWEGGQPRRRGEGRMPEPQAGNSRQTESANLQLFNKLVKYLEERVYESISLDELVAEFHFSKTHLSHTFKAYSGQTILTYYNNLKVEEAKQLILNTDMNFSQISNQLNFSSLHYFSRLFKKHTGMSPSEYQNAVLE